MNEQVLRRLQINSRRSAIVSLLAALIIMAALLLSAMKLRELRQGIARETQTLQKLRSEADSLTKKIAELKPLAVQGLGSVKPSAEISSAEIDESLKAYAARQKLGATGKERRRAITIQYFPKDIEKAMNQTIVLPALDSLGFRLQEMRASTIPGETNALWCGASVHVDDVKLVALTLLAAGVKLRAIREFRNSNKPGIQIGGDRRQSAAPLWTTERVLMAASFERENQ